MPSFLTAIAVVQAHTARVTIDPSFAVPLAIVAVALILFLASQTLTARRRARQLEESFGRRLEAWVNGEKARIINEQLLIARREAQVSLVEWKQREEDAIRQDAIKRSQSVIVGKVTEHMVPFLPDFPWNPKDARFIGAPIDFLVFDGLDDGQLRNIVLVEVKTSSSLLTSRERQIREAVHGGRIGWREIRIDYPTPSTRPTTTTPAQLPPASRTRP